MYAHFVLSVCVAGGGGGWGVYGSFPSHTHKKKAREVYALRFVHSSSCVTAVTEVGMQRTRTRNC